MRVAGDSTLEDLFFRLTEAPAEALIAPGAADGRAAANQSGEQ
jgi:hypothetical protein